MAEKAKGGARISFWTYSKVGIPVTLLTLAWGLGVWAVLRP